MAEMKAGYKQTDIGVIPEDWDVRPMSNLTTLMTNGFVGTAKSHYTDGHHGITYIQGYNVEENGFNFHGIKKVTPEFHKKHSKSRLKADDILMVQTGDVGLVTIVPPELEGSNCHALIINRFKSTSEPKFFVFLLNSLQIRQRLKELETGTTMKHINVGNLLRFKLPFPKSKNEQKAIAAALSDTDGLIESIEQLIAKKRDMKTAAMQQLLTGNKRLPGFESITGYQQTDVGLIPKDWELVRLGDVADIDKDNLSSSTPSSHEIRYISLEDVKEGSLLGFSILYFMSAPSRARRKLKYGDVLLGTVRPNLKSHLLFRQEGENFVCSTGFAAIRPHPHKANNEYIYAHLFGDVINHQIDKVLAGSNYPAISNSDVKNLFVPLPKPDEQTVIANVLSDMDTEINALELRLEKARSLKTGMMQELLTGKIRLIKTDKFQEVVA